MTSKQGAEGSAPKRSSKRAALASLLFALITGVAICGPMATLAAPADNAATLAAPAENAEIFHAVPYGPLPDQVLDVHLPTTDAKPYPVIVYVHGGGWIAGTRAIVPDFLLAEVARGVALVSIDYRLVTTAPDGTSVNAFPVPVTDVDRAVRFVRAHAERWALDPGRMLLAGASAGGHLAALAAAAPGVFVDPDLPSDLAKVSPRVQGVMVFVGVTDFSTFGDAGGWAPGLMAALLDCPPTRFELCDPAKVSAASVAPHLDSTAPPAFLVYGSTDTLVAPATQGAPLAAAWTQARGDRPEPTLTHGVYFQVTSGGHNVDTTQLDADAMQRWLADVFEHPMIPAELVAA